MSDRDEFYRQFSRSYDKLHQSEMQDDLVERMAEELWQAESVRACGRRRNVPWADAGVEARKKWLPLASAAIALALEEAAKVAEGMWWRGRANLATAPYAAAEQAGDEIAVAIRAMITKDKA